MSRKIIDYTTCAAGTLTELDEIVSKKIKEGWQPFGGASGMQEREHKSLAVGVCQALVKYEEACQFDVGPTKLAFLPKLESLPDKVFWTTPDPIPEVLGTFLWLMQQERVSLRKAYNEIPKPVWCLSVNNSIEIEDENLIALVQRAKLSLG